jgi:cation transport regulator ChaC
MGVAFAFADLQSEVVMAYLREREGGFDFKDVNLTLTDGRHVRAVTSVYRGKNLLGDLSLSDVAQMVSVAVGTDGKCSDYILNVDQHLRETGIIDPVVSALAAAVVQLRKYGSRPH